MCGIFGYVGGRTDAAQIVFEGLKALEYRGYDSWGIACVPTENNDVVKSTPGRGSKKLHTKDTQIVVKKKAGKIGNATVSDMPDSSFALGHTRWATHGGVTDVNAHPHLDCTGNIALVHNGIVENYDDIKRRLSKRGHRFVSETDTEIAGHLIEEYAKTLPFPDAVRRAFNSFTGLNAMIAIKTTDRQFVAVRSGSPLVVGMGTGENFLASDPAALLPYTKCVHFLDDGEMAVITDQSVQITNVQTGQTIPVKKQILQWKPQQATKGAYRFFMEKEMFEQPQIMETIARTGLSQAQKIAAAIRRAHGTYMVGCGTAAYACLAGSYLFSKIAKRHVNWAIGSEFGYHLDFLNKKSLVIAISQSGETMDLLEGTKKAKERGAIVIALVNVLGSTLYRQAHEKLLIGAGPEKAVASTKAFTGMLSHLILLAYALAGNSNEGQRVLLSAVSSTRKILSPKNLAQIRMISQRLKTARHIYVIGRGLSYPTSLEMALKIKEISYIHAEGLAAGELKHGPLALVTKGTPCIAYLPNDETYGANLAGAMEMKARGGMIIGISHKPHEVFDEYLHVDDAAEATIIPNVVVAQLLAYELATSLGLDPDMPRNLAKSVTVK